MTYETYGDIKSLDEMRKFVGQPVGQTEVLIPPFLHLLGKIGKVCVSKVYLFFPVHFALTRIVFPALASHHPLCVQARYLPVPILNAIAYSEPVVSKMAEL